MKRTILIETKRLIDETAPGGHVIQASEADGQTIVFGVDHRQTELDNHFEAASALINDLDSEMETATGIAGYGSLGPNHYVFITNRDA